MQVSGLSHLRPVVQFPSLPPLLDPQKLPLAFRHGTTVQLLALAAWQGPGLAAGDLQVCPDGHPLFGVWFELQTTPVLVLPLKQNPRVVFVSSHCEISPLLKPSIAEMQSTWLP